MKKRIVLADIKLNKAKLNIVALKDKAKDLLASYPGSTLEFPLHSLIGSEFSEKIADSKGEQPADR